MLPESIDEPQVPLGLNHLVLNVRDIEASHAFWTQMLGFEHVGTSAKSFPPGNPPMRFYSGRRGGELHHHDIALYESAALRDSEGAVPQRLDHVAIEYGSEEAWRAQVEFLVRKGLNVHTPVARGMSYSVSLEDPDGVEVELLYELPRDRWETDIQRALNTSARLRILEMRSDSPVAGTLAP